MSEIVDFIEQFAKIKKEGGICSTDKKLKVLLDKINFIKNKTYKDDFFWLATNEKHLLGVSLSVNEIDIYTDSRITHSCKQVLVSKPGYCQTIGVDICLVKEYITRSGESEGRKRADIVVQDSTAQLKIKIWSDVYERISHMIIEGNCVIIAGERGYGKYSDYFIAKEVYQAG